MIIWAKGVLRQADAEEILLHYIFLHLSTNSYMKRTNSYISLFFGFCCGKMLMLCIVRGI